MNPEQENELRRMVTCDSVPIFDRRVIKSTCPICGDVYATDEKAPDRTCAKPRCHILFGLRVRDRVRVLPPVGGVQMLALEKRLRCDRCHQIIGTATLKIPQGVLIEPPRISFVCDDCIEREKEEIETLVYGDGTCKDECLQESSLSQEKRAQVARARQDIADFKAAFDAGVAHEQPDTPMLVKSPPSTF